MRHNGHVSVRPFLAHAVAATAAVVLAPAVVVFALIGLLDPDPPVLLSAGLGVALAIGVAVLGTILWMRTVQSRDIGFGDLMLWRWVARRRAETRLDEGARLLGLDRSGHPVDQVRISPEEQLQVLKDLTAALESKDPYTHGHSQRVERHVYRTATAMGLDAHAIEDLRKAAALHDVGKVRVPDRVLRKPGGLTIEERAIVEEHAVVGAWMVSSVGGADVISAVRHHHERWDGLGYPDGVSGPDIPLFARIIAVADAFDAITSTRPYRTSAGRDHAVDVLRDGSGTQFDPDVVEAFVAALPERVPIAAGMLLLLAGPDRLLRQLAAWFKRLGAGSITPAVGAAGAAVVLGASVFTPNVVSERPQTPPAVASASDTSNETAGAPARPAKPAKKAAENPAKRKAAAKKKAARRQQATQVAHGDHGATDVLGQAADGGIDVLGQAAQRDEPTGSAPVTTSQPTGGGDTRDRKPAPRGDPQSDPQPDKGKDCQKSKSGRGHGHEMHCG